MKLPMKVKAPLILVAGFFIGMETVPRLIKGILHNLSGWTMTIDGAAFWMGGGAFLGLAVSVAYLVIELEEPKK